MSENTSTQHKGNQHKSGPLGPSIIVGVDGSENSIAALKWAIREAALRDVSLGAVETWQYGYYGADSLMLMPDLTVIENSTRESLAASVEKALDGELANVPITQIVLEGSAARRLTELSENAELVVVGARGHGGFVGLLLGSVATQVANHARCPVVVVHEQRPVH